MGPKLFLGVHTYGANASVATRQSPSDNFYEIRGTLVQNSMNSGFWHETTVPYDVMW